MVIRSNSLDYTFLDDGTDGVPGGSLYTWVKYGTSSSGANMSDDPTGCSYIGLAYNKTTATESSDPTDYTWSKIQGETGSQGVSVSGVTPQYYLSTSNQTTTGGTWSDTRPTITTDTYLWTREKTELSNGTFVYSDPTYDATITNLVFDVDDLNNQIVTKVSSTDFHTLLVGDQAIQDISQTATTASQTASKFSWLVSSGTGSSNMTLTSDFIELMSEDVVIKSPDGQRTVISGGMMSVDAIQSNNYVYTSGNYSNAGTKFDLSNGVLRSQNFAILSDGSAFFDGTLYSDNGEIGGWNISNNNLWSKSSETNTDWYTVFQNLPQHYPPFYNADAYTYIIEPTSGATSVNVVVEFSIAASPSNNPNAYFTVALSDSNGDIREMTCTYTDRTGETMGGQIVKETSSSESYNYSNSQISWDNTTHNVIQTSFSIINFDPSTYIIMSIQIKSQGAQRPYDSVVISNGTVIEEGSYKTLRRATTYGVPMNAVLAIRQVNSPGGQDEYDVIPFYLLSDGTLYCQDIFGQNLTLATNNPVIQAKIDPPLFTMVGYNKIGYIATNYHNNESVEFIMNASSGYSGIYRSDTSKWILKSNGNYIKEMAPIQGYIKFDTDTSIKAEDYYGTEYKAFEVTDGGIYIGSSGNIHGMVAIYAGSTKSSSSATAVKNTTIRIMGNNGNNAWASYDAIHSGNYSDYAIPNTGGNITSDHGSATLTGDKFYLKSNSGYDCYYEAKNNGNLAARFVMSNTGYRGIFQADTASWLIRGNTSGDIDQLAYIDCNLRFKTTGKGLMGIDSTGAGYGMIYENGTNLVIGATSTSGTHHTGQLNLSAGLNSTSGKPNTTAYILANNGSDAWATYQILHANNWQSVTNVGKVIASGNGGASWTDATLTTAQYKSVGSFTLAAGQYLVIVNGNFASNATGRRLLMLTSTENSSSGLYNIATQHESAVNGAQTTCRLVVVLQPSASTTYYVTAYQNSGGNLNITTRYTIIQIR